MANAEPTDASASVPLEESNLQGGGGAQVPVAPTEPAEPPQPTTSEKNRDSAIEPESSQSKPVTSSGTDEPTISDTEPTA